MSDTVCANGPWSWTYFQHIRYLLKFWVRIRVLYLPTSQKSICRVLKCDTKLYERQREHFTSKLVNSLPIRKLIIRPYSYCTDFTSEHSTYEYEYVTILSTLLVLKFGFAEADYGIAETLAMARNTSVQGIVPGTSNQAAADEGR